MGDVVRTDGRSICETLHELAEGLQATGNYLSALKHELSTGKAGVTPFEVTERAITQWARAVQATRELRALLADRTQA